MRERESTIRISTRCREERRDCVRIKRERERDMKREIERGREKYDNRECIIRKGWVQG